MAVIRRNGRLVRVESRDTNRNGISERRKQVETKKREDKIKANAVKYERTLKAQLVELERYQKSVERQKKSKKGKSVLSAQAKLSAQIKLIDALKNQKLNIITGKTQPKDILKEYDVQKARDIALKSRKKQTQKLTKQLQKQLKKREKFDKAFQRVGEAVKLDTKVNKQITQIREDSSLTELQKEDKLRNVLNIPKGAPTSIPIEKAVKNDPLNLNTLTVGEDKRNIIAKAQSKLERLRLEAIKGDKNAKASLLGVINLPVTALNEGINFISGVYEFTKDPSVVADTVKDLNSSSVKQIVSDVGTNSGQALQRGDPVALVTLASLITPVKIPTKVTQAINKIPLPQKIKIFSESSNRVLKANGEMLGTVPTWDITYNPVKLKQELTKLAKVEKSKLGSLKTKFNNAQKKQEQIKIQKDIDVSLQKVKSIKNSAKYIKINPNTIAKGLDKLFPQTSKKVLEVKVISKTDELKDAFFNNSTKYKKLKKKYESQGFKVKLTPIKDRKVFNLKSGKKIQDYNIELIKTPKVIKIKGKKIKKEKIKKIDLTEPQDLTPKQKKRIEKALEFEQGQKLENRLEFARQVKKAEEDIKIVLKKNKLVRCK